MHHCASCKFHNSCLGSGSVVIIIIVVAAVVVAVIVVNYGRRQTVLQSGSLAAWQPRLALMTGSSRAELHFRLILPTESVALLKQFS